MLTVQSASFMWDSDVPMKKVSDTELSKLDQVNSNGLVNKFFDETERDMELIERSIEVHGTI